MWAVTEYFDIRIGLKIRQVDNGNRVSLHFWIEPLLYIPRDFDSRADPLSKVSRFSIAIWIRFGLTKNLKIYRDCYK